MLWLLNCWPPECFHPLSWFIYVSPVSSLFYFTPYIKFKCLGSSEVNGTFVSNVWNKLTVHIMFFLLCTCVCARTREWVCVSHLAEPSVWQQLLPLCWVFRSQCSFCCSVSRTHSHTHIHTYKHMCVFVRAILCVRCADSCCPIVKSITHTQEF